MNHFQFSSLNLFSAKMKPAANNKVMNAAKYGIISIIFGYLSVSKELQIPIWTAPTIQ